MRATERQAAAARPAREFRLQGHGVCAGVAVGQAFCTSEAEHGVEARRIAPAEVSAELDRLEVSVERSLRQLARLRTQLAVLPEESQAELAPLLDAYRQMLGASRLLRGIRTRIAGELVSAETAVAAETEALAARLLDVANQDPDALARRAGEVREAGRRLVRNLAGAPFRSLSSVPRGAVLVADRLRPAEIALIDPTRVGAVVTEEGGQTDHTAIMLASLGIPAVIAAAGVVAAAEQGAVLVVDGGAGSVTVSPTEPTLAAARKAVAGFLRERQRMARLRRLPAELASGEKIELQANLEFLAELPLIAQSGATGIGLLRTEFLFVAAGELPDAATQTRAYAEVLRAMAGDTVTIRLLDWGGEKESAALERAGLLPRERESNPALGVRGLRLLLAHPELLETQLAAILAAAAHGPVRVLLPMVTTLGELRAVRELLERVARRTRGRGRRANPPPLGVMIETPGAALMADAFALEADFLSIGTNDLTMYALAADRGANGVSALYDPLHPAVLRLIAMTTEAALRLRKPVSICGEMAANPACAPLLLGLGIRSFSMNAQSVPRVKQAIRHAGLDDCVRLARRALELTDTEAVARLLSPGPAA